VFLYSIISIMKFAFLSSAMRAVVRGTRAAGGKGSQLGEPTELQIAHEKRAMEQRLRADGYSRRAAAIIVAERFAGLNPERSKS
jgi:hypothetical protein